MSIITDLDENKTAGLSCAKETEAARRPPPLFYFPYPSSTSTSPYTALAAVPQAITGPAIVNIFTMVPVISPSA